MSGLEICLRILFRLVFALLDVVDRLRRNNPGSRGDIVNRRLHALRAMLREQTEVFATHFDFGPNAVIQHWGHQAWPVFYDRRLWAVVIFRLQVSWRRRESVTPFFKVLGYPAVPYFPFAS